VPMSAAGQQFLRAAKSKLPAVYQLRNFVEDGGLASYGEDHKQIARRSAYLVDRIFKGTNPRDLPVEEPVTFVLAVNLKAAAALSLTIPDAILTAPTRRSTDAEVHESGSGLTRTSCDVAFAPLLRASRMWRPATRQLFVHGSM